MPHRCARCGKMFPDASKQLLEGCDSCGGRFFYFIRKEALEKMSFPKLQEDQVDEIEEDIREIIGQKKIKDSPIVLDVETVQIKEPGKYLIDLTKIFSKKRPIVYKIEDGKYYIDLSSLEVR